MESEKAIEKESRFVLRAPTSDVFNMNGLMQLQLWSPSEATCPDVSLFTTSSVFAFLSSCISYFVAGIFALSFSLSVFLFLSLSLFWNDVYTFTRTAPAFHLPRLSVSLLPFSSLSLSVSRFGSYVYFISRFLHPLAATLHRSHPPSPSTSTNILIIP